MMMTKKTAIRIFLPLKAAILVMAVAASLAQGQGKAASQAAAKSDRVGNTAPAAAPAAPVKTAQAANPSAALPNGANALNETFSDWQVSCRTENDKRACAMIQQQRKKDTNQLVLAMEATRFSDEGIGGTLVLPFGLKLADGMTLQVDDAAASSPLAFSTCLPVGCIVPFWMGKDQVDALRKGTALKLAAKASDGGQAIAFSVSLKGFGAALDRVAALAGR